MKPAKHKFTLLKQVIEIIPAYIVPKLARELDVDKRARTFFTMEPCFSLNSHMH
jgi:hypothetical protein